MTINEVPERKNIPDKDKWNLEAIYSSFEEWQKAFDDTQSRIDTLKSYSVKARPYCWSSSKQRKQPRSNLADSTPTPT